MINEQVSVDHEYYLTDREPLVRLVRGTPNRVLELGCGSGLLIGRLKKLGCKYICGIEAHEQIAARARLTSGADEIIACDIERTPPHFPPASFDLIVASHVLEHLADPWKVTKLLAYWLRPGGQFVGAIPNVRHARVVLSLLLRGTWTYEQAGILDWTHLRFFTRNEIGKLLESADLRVDCIDPEVTGQRSNLLRFMSCGLLTDFAAYAYNFSATKK